MSGPRVRSSRFARYAPLLMIVLGAFAIVVDTTIALVLIALGLVMFVFERAIVGRSRGRNDTPD